MKFGLITREFTTLECVQQASIITGVTLTTFARERHCVDQYSVLYRYSSVKGDTAMPGGLHARLCHAFLHL